MKAAYSHITPTKRNIIEFPVKQPVIDDVPDIAISCSTGDVLLEELPEGYVIYDSQHKPIWRIFRVTN